ncbi:MAG: aminoglycoside phosphotransferase family protein [Patescibacteria group bacterium]
MDIRQLYDEQFILKYLRKRILPLYSECKTIKKIKIKGIKNNIWENSYHVVVEYNVYFSTQTGKTKTLLIYCSAHSHEPRRNIYAALRFLWNAGFARGNLTIPHPLFYSQRFRGVFYRGLTGKNLYHFIKEKDLAEVRRLVILSARWFAKLHRLPTAGAKNFNRQNSLIETTVPGAKHWLKKIEERYPEDYGLVYKIFSLLNRQEKTYLAAAKKRYLVHGDAHPENVIRVTKNKIGLIDFTDMCLGDFARDLGAFTQQLEYMAGKYFTEPEVIAELKQTFLNEYLSAAKLKLTEDLTQRIGTYYYWTALRTAVYLFVNQHHEPERARLLINKLKGELKIN